MHLFVNGSKRRYLVVQLRDDSELLPQRLNTEPSVFRGCSLSEVLVLALIFSALLIPISIILLSLVGYALMGVGIGVLLAMGSTFIGATLLQKLKRGRPIGYYRLQIVLLLDKFGLRKSGITKRSGKWVIGRSSNGQ